MKMLQDKLMVWDLCVFLPQLPLAECTMSSNCLGYLLWEMTMNPVKRWEAMMWVKIWNVKTNPRLSVKTDEAAEVCEPRRWCIILRFFGGVERGRRMSIFVIVATVDIRAVIPWVLPSSSSSSSSSSS